MSSKNSFQTREKTISFGNIEDMIAEFLHRMKIVPDNLEVRITKIGDLDMRFPRDKIIPLHYIEWEGKEAEVYVTEYNGKN